VATPAPRPEPTPKPEEPAHALDVANAWAEMNNADHLARARAEEYRRRARAEDRRLSRNDDHRRRYPSGLHQ
jgi:hypothetical protein